MPNSSNVPPDSLALKGKKSLPNRFSLVNSYDFVIRENCTKCKPTMPNCDSSKLMPLITVSGETQWELEQQLRLSLILELASSCWCIVHGHHIHSPCWALASPHVRIAAYWGAGCDGGKAAKHVPPAVSCCKKDSWSSRAKRDGTERGWDRKQAARETRNQWCAGWRSKGWLCEKSTLLTRTGRATRWSP